MSNPQPTIEEIWFVFQTLLEAAHSQQLITIDVLTFIDTCDEEAIKALDYKQWHNRPKRAAKILAEITFPILAEHMLGEYSEPDGISTLHLDDSAFALYRDALADPSVFAAFISGELHASEVGSPPEDALSEDMDNALAGEYSHDDPALPQEDVGEMLTSPVSGEPDTPEQRYEPDPSAEEVFDAIARKSEAQDAGEWADDNDQSHKTKIFTVDSGPGEAESPSTQDNEAMHNSPDPGSMGVTADSGDLFASRRAGSDRSSMFTPSVAPKSQHTGRRQVKVDQEKFLANTVTDEDISSSNQSDTGTEPSVLPPSSDAGDGDRFSGRRSRTDESEKPLSSGARSRQSRTVPPESQQPREQLKPRQTFGDTVRQSNRPVSDNSPRRRLTSNNPGSESAQNRPVEDNRSSRRRGSSQSNTQSVGPRRRMSQETEDLRPQGPRSRRSTPSSETVPPTEEDIQIVSLPSGEEVRFSKSVLERLIAEHGSLTNVIRWYLEQQEEED